MFRKINVILFYENQFLGKLMLFFSYQHQFLGKLMLLFNNNIDYSKN